MLRTLLATVLVASVVTSSLAAPTVQPKGLSIRKNRHEEYTADNEFDYTLGYKLREKRGSIVAKGPCSNYHCSFFLVPVSKPNGECACETAGGSKRDVATQTVSTEFDESSGSKKKRDIALEQAEHEEKRGLIVAKGPCSNYHCPFFLVRVSKPNGECACETAGGSKRDVASQTTELGESLSTKEKQDIALEQVEHEEKRGWLGERGVCSHLHCSAGETPVRLTDGRCECYDFNLIGKFKREITSRQAEPEENRDVLGQIIVGEYRRRRHHCPAFQIAPAAKAGGKVGGFECVGSGDEPTKTLDQAQVAPTGS
ncbi:MAG: hypothetical protein Q9191_003327 [Dirinaria sp. TL-2023a]